MEDKHLYSLNFIKSKVLDFDSLNLQALYCFWFTESLGKSVERIRLIDGLTSMSPHIVQEDRCCSCVSHVIDPR